MNFVKNIITELVETLIVSFVVIFLIYRFIASMEVVSGASMEPNFDTGERILVDKVSPFFKSYRRGEVVVLSPPNEPNKHYIKRLVGIPGDTFKILECKVLITNNSEKYEIEETYLSEGTCTSGGMNIREGRSLKLKEGEYVVLGDNRSFSVDSRFFGVVTTKNLLGRVVFRFWPVKKMGFIR